MKFGRGRTADADGPRSEGGGTLPVDFMRDSAWTALVAPLLRGEVNPRTLARLPRKDRDYIYRAVSQLNSPISVERTRAWYQEAPSANVAALVGAAKVKDARRIRMGRRLFDLTPSESQRHAVILADAESFLLNACSHYPDSVLPWIPRIDLAYGLSLGPDEILRRFAEAQARERWNFLAAEATFAGLQPGSSGSYELLFGLGTDAMSGTPPGHAARSLVATAEAERIMNDRNLNLSHMPARSGLDFTRLFVHHVRALPDELDPDDVIGLGAFMFVAIPRNREEAEAVLLGLELLRGRCGGEPYGSLNDPLAWFRRTLASRESEARALLVA